MSAPGIITPVPSTFAPPRAHRAVGTWIAVLALISIMMAEILAGSAGMRSMVETFGLRASEWSWGDPADYGRMLSHIFLHNSAEHFFVNTIVLLLAGSVVETRLGWRAISALIIAGTVMSAAAHLLLFPAEVRPLIGASGTVSTILGAAFIIVGDTGLNFRLPLTRLRLLVSLRRVLAVWLAIQIVGLVTVFLPGQPPASVATWVHLAGFATGVMGALAYHEFGTTARSGATQPALVESFASGGD